MALENRTPDRSASAPVTSNITSATQGSLSETSASIPAVDSISRVGWGGIFAGAMTTIGLMMLFTLLGAAIGLSALNIAAGETPSQAAQIGGGIYAFVTLLVSFYLGGYVSTKLAQPRMRARAAFHGLTTWALLAVGFLFLLGSGFSSVLSGLFSFAGDTAQNLFRSGGSTAGIENQLGQIFQGGPSGTDVADTARNVARGGIWATFFAFFFGALAALLGGINGASTRYEKTWRLRGRGRAAPEEPPVPQRRAA